MILARVFSGAWVKLLALVLAGMIPQATADELRLRQPANQGERGTSSVSPDHSLSSRQNERILLPDIGSSSGNLFTPAGERRLGARFMNSVRQSLPIIEDPILADYIQNLGARLVAHSDAPNSDFTFFLIDEPLINAFAGPGGYIGIYTGLILENQTESELASVLAHEIAHVTQHHLFRAFEKANRMSGPAAILLLGAVLLGAASGSGDAAIAAAAGVQAGVAQSQINFTRTNEEEADRVGIKNLAKAGYDPRAMPLFFERLARATRMYESNAPEFLRTHPVTTNRIADSRNRAESYPYQQKDEELQFHLVQTTLRLRQFKHPEQAVEYFQKTLANKDYRNEDAQRYGYTLSLMLKHNYALARKQLDQLLRKHPDEITFLIVDARLDQITGNRRKSLLTLETALQLYPGNYPLVMAYAGSLLDMGEAIKAKTVLLDAKKALPTYPNMYLLLARAAGESGDVIAAHQYQAEYYYLRYQLESAIQQLEIALRKKNLSFYQSSRLEARLNEFKMEKETLSKDL